MIVQWASGEEGNKTMSHDIQLRLDYGRAAIREALHRYIAFLPPQWKAFYVGLAASDAMEIIALEALED